MSRNDHFMAYGCSFRTQSRNGYEQPHKILLRKLCIMVVRETGLCTDVHRKKKVTSNGGLASEVNAAYCSVLGIGRSLWRRGMTVTLFYFTLHRNYPHTGTGSECVQIPWFSIRHYTEHASCSHLQGIIRLRRAFSFACCSGAVTTFRPLNERENDREEEEEGQHMLIFWQQE